MVRSTIPALIHYGKYNIQYCDHKLHKFTPLTKKKFNIQLFSIFSGIIICVGSAYGAMYYYT